MSESDPGSESDSEYDGQEEEGDLLLIYLVLSFGWSGSPGEWTPWAMAILQIFQSFKPAHPTRDGPERFRAWALVDDGVMVEPMLGIRPWLAGSLYESAAKRLLGPDAMNQEKNDLEGTWRSCQTVWGIDFDTKTMLRASQTSGF